MAYRSSNELPSPLRALLAWRRRARLHTLLGQVKTWPGMKVLDVGCGVDGRSFEDHVDQSWEITGIDIARPEEIHHTRPRFKYMTVDVRDMTVFADGEFDLVVSIGMLEHITPPADYEAACREMQRVGKQYAIMVPYKWAWIEPHYWFPFFGALPSRVQIAVIRLLNLSGHRDHIQYFLDNFRWRTRKEYLRDFPGSHIKLMPTLEMMAIIK